MQDCHVNHPLACKFASSYYTTELIEIRLFIAEYRFYSCITIKTCHMYNPQKTTELLTAAKIDTWQQ